MKVQQFVMAYGAEQDRLRALLPEGFSSLRPVLRVNAEIRDGKTGCLELNTAVEKNGKRGWLNLGFWTEVPFERAAGTVTFRTALLEIAFTPVGVRGGCPAEKDNAGCFFLGNPPELRPPEVITAGKEFCDCAFRWLLPEGPMGSARGRPSPPFHPRPGGSIPGRILPWKTPPGFRAARSWGPIGWSFSGKDRELCPGKKKSGIF